jgi:DNA-binding MarR family transcriptional regulator
MERTGFVQRTTDPSDRRVTRLRLTERGEAVVEAVTAAWAQMEGQATAGLTDDEARQLIRLLTIVRDNLE